MKTAPYMAVGNAYMKLLGRDWVVVLAPTFSPFHVQGFNPKSIRHLLDKTGYVVRDFTIEGAIRPQTGNRSLRKEVEFHAGRLVNWLGRLTGRGMYMYIWAQKR